MAYLTEAKRTAILKKVHAARRREIKTVLDELAAMEGGLVPPNFQFGAVESVQPAGPTAAAGASADVARADHAHDISESAFFSGVFSGSDGAGPCTLTGAKTGDKVILLTNLTDAADGKASFEAAITVEDQIQQTGAADLSLKKFAVLLLVKSGTVGGPT